VDVASYTEFCSLLVKYATQEAVPVSFNVSNDLDLESYGKIVDDLLGSNKKKSRCDKIEHPRPDHRPGPIIECNTLEEIKNVYKAIGRNWRAKIPLLWDEASKNKKLHAEMYEFIEEAKILSHY
jgi:hypothetical protein